MQGYCALFFNYIYIGVHPFLLGVEQDGNAFGIFILNSNAMELTITPYPSLQYKTIGGILDIFIFLGPTPNDVIMQYWDVIGKPFLPPYWSLVCIIVLYILFIFINT